jgi:hypothetical protein
MINVFDFLYYCLYRIFTLVKRVGEKDENLASLLYSLMLSTNTITLSLLPLKFIIPKGFFAEFPLNVLFYIIFITVFIIWYFVCKHYFLKKENYVRIISHYEEKYPTEKIRFAIIGITFFILTPTVFITIAIWLSHIKWHL